MLMIVVMGVSGTQIQTDYQALKGSGRAEYLAGRFKNAELFLQNALAVAEKNADDDAIAATAAELGNVYQSEDRLPEAEEAYARALSIVRRSSRQDALVVILLNLGVTYSLGGRYSQALKTLEEAWKTNQISHDEMLRAQILNSMGMVYLRNGKTRKAEVLFNQAKAARGIERPEPDLIDAQILNNLGAVYQRRHKYQEAEKSYQKAVKITQEQLGPAHPDLALTFANLGELHTAMGRYVEAAEDFGHGLLILEQMNPVPYARITRMYQEFSKMYLQNKDQANAELTLVRAVQIGRRNPVPDPNFPDLLDTYAAVLKASGQLQEAERARVEARAIRAAFALTVRVSKSH